MYEHAQAQMETILQLVSKCPDSLQERCFSILLKGYVRSQLPSPSLTPPANGESVPSLSGAADQPAGGLKSHGVPPEIDNRFQATAKRIGVDVAALSALFDFNADPFTYHALHVPGQKKSEKTRDVALLVAARTYLASGQWNADWKEFRAQCVDQNCYDRRNMAAHLKHDFFKSASSESGIALSGNGVKAAEALLAKLAGKKD